MTLTKATLVQRLRKRIGLTAAAAEATTETILECMKATLVRGEKVSIHGFGRFSVQEKASRTTLNPRTGEAMRIKARRVVAFKASEVLKARLSGAEPSRRRRCEPPTEAAEG